MKTWIRLFVVMLVVVLCAANISAQPEPCGTLPGLPCTPTPQQADDRDGDGVADFVDQCPDQAGTGFTNGCPDTIQGDAPTATPAGVLTAPLNFPLSGECLIGNFGNVNVRVEPDTESDILMVLTPGSFLWALYIVINDIGESWYYTLVDGYVRTDVVQNNGNCDDLDRVRILSITADLGLPLPPDDPNAAPPPDDTDCYYWIIYMGNVVCLLSEPPILTADLPSGDSAPPPDDLFCEYEVIIDGNAICLIDDATDLTANGIDPQAVAPGQPFCYRSDYVNQFQCIAMFAPQAASPNAAPPPDDPTCYYWVVYMGNAICLISIEPNFALDTGGGEQTREHILLARQVGVPAECELYPGSHALYQDITIPPSVQDAMGDPIPTEGCVFQLFIQVGDPQAADSLPTESVSFNFQRINLDSDDPADYVLLLPASDGQPARTLLCVVPGADQPTVCNTVGR